MSVRGPNNVGRNVGSCWLKSLTAFKLCATTRNRVCKRTQHVTSNSVGSCCVRLHAVLHQRVGEHKNMSSSNDKHCEDKHSTVPKDIDKQFSVLKKCNKKFDCLVYEMLLIRELKSSLSDQSDSIWANVLRDVAYVIYADHHPKRFLSISLSAITLNLKMAWRWHRNVVRSYPRYFLLVSV